MGYVGILRGRFAGGLWVGVGLGAAGGVSEVYFVKLAGEKQVRSTRAGALARDDSVLYGLAGESGSIRDSVAVRAQG